MMTAQQKTDIKRMRGAGMSYGQISDALGISVGTLKTYCRRNGVAGKEADGGHYCLCCGKAVRQNPGRKEKKFCSDGCRNRWWNSNLDKVDRRANYDFVCACCKKPFTAYGNANRKYCSHQCYIEDRFGGGCHE